MPSPAGKWNQHLHKACQQKEAWSALKSPGRWLRWLWTSENTRLTPANDMAAQIITDCGNSHWTSRTWILCLSSLPPDSVTLIYKWNAKCTFIWKEDFGPLSISPVLQVRCFWWCFWFRSGLVALFLKMSERGDSWCTDSSFSSLLVKLSQVFESALLDCILKLAVIPVAFALFPPNFFLPVNFVFNMLWYSTPWTAPPPPPPPFQ